MTPTGPATIRQARREGKSARPPAFPAHHPKDRLRYLDSLLPILDVDEILALIHELAAYEHAASSVEATTDSLLRTLNFADSVSPRQGYASTFLITVSTPSTDSKNTASEQIAGLALYFTNYSTWRAAPGVYLEDLFIRPAFRRRGYGKALIGALAAETVRIGGKRLEWSVLRWNEPSIKFYESLGAVGMTEWMGMRVDGEGLVRLAQAGQTTAS
ncbi:MAG: hypothetical protein M1819_003422 [Sarea resinae]|nr:MAG: hypothetical protein M1819_003422 [Sarea resinae]